MKKLLLISENKTIQNLSLLLLGITSLLLLIIDNAEFINFKAYDNDRYGTAFLNFWRLGWYNGCAEGYGILYNKYVGIFYKFTNNIYSSFFYANIISQVLCAIVSIKLFNKYKEKVSFFSFSIVYILAITILLNTKGYNASYDDCFLSVFISLFTYVLFSNNEKILYSPKLSISLGVLLAVCLAIRPTSVFLFFSFFIVLLFLVIHYKPNFKSIISFCLYITIPFLVLTSILHYPSIKEKGKLCFYDKNPKTGANWTQRNYHALLQMRNGKEPYEKAVFWDKQRWKKLDLELEEKGKNYIPETFTKVLIANPPIVAFITGYNLSFTFFWLFRNFGIVIILLFLLLKKDLEFNLRLPFIMFMAVAFSVSFVSLTFMEVRWFSGYLILVPIAIINSIMALQKTKFIKYLNLFLIINVFIMSLFNLKSIYSLWMLLQTSL